MRYLSLILLFAGPTFGQIHNRLIKMNVGFSSEAIVHKSDVEAYADTSSIPFEFVSSSPAISFTHEWILGNVLSISGRAGFQYMNMYYNHQHYGSPYVNLSVNPALSLFYRKRFEYYVKLQIGVNYWMNNPELLSPALHRVFPEKLNIFTGVTLGGFNYYFSDKWGANLELSLWSPELCTFGISYRFFKGELPSIQELQEL
ncbi:MAG: hypothetical protein ACPG21_08795 [Crocinitomicaceae bacterium]